MCRLFGFRSHILLKVHHSLLEAENALVIQSLDHPDGWGLGYYEDGHPRISKGTAAAFRDQDYSALCRSLSSHAVIAHVRQATVGHVSDENTHPFHYQNWIFAHNGTVFGFPQLRPYFLEEIASSLRPFIRGTTDSEHCFWLFLSELEARCDLDQPTADAVQEALTVCLQKIAAWCRLVGIRKAPCMNFVITNGEIFAASRLGRDLLFSTQKVKCSDFVLCTDHEKHCLGQRRPSLPITHLLVASERISAEDVWEVVPNNAILVVDEAMLLRIVTNVVSLEDLEFAPLPVSLHGLAIAN